MRRNLRQDFIFLANPHLHLIASGCNARCRFHWPGRKSTEGKKEEARGAGRHEGEIQEFFATRQIIIP